MTSYQVLTTLSSVKDNKWILSCNGIIMQFAQMYQYNCRLCIMMRRYIAQYELHHSTCMLTSEGKQKNIMMIFFIAYTMQGHMQEEFPIISVLTLRS